MARPLYIQTKNQQYAPSGVTITNPDLLIAGNKDMKTKFDQSLGQVVDFEKGVQELINYMKDESTGGIEQTGRFSENGRRLNAKQDALTLKMKELFNLGVLQEIDLKAMQKLLPDATGMGSWLKAVSGIRGREGFVKQYEALMQTFADKINAYANPLGLNYKVGSANSNPYSSMNTTNIMDINPGSYVTQYGFQVPQGRGQ